MITETFKFILFVVLPLSILLAIPEQLAPHTLGV